MEESVKLEMVGLAARTTALATLVFDLIDLLHVEKVLSREKAIGRVKLRVDQLGQMSDPALNLLTAAFQEYLETLLKHHRAQDSSGRPMNPL